MIVNWRLGLRKFSIVISLALSAATIPLLERIAQAQITPDGTTNTTVEVDGNDFTIQQGDRVGSNLFHSFGEFSIPTDGSAVFNNAADIVNIFSRVTGGNLSNIDGLLGANGSANLFLLNPAGIMFGENARLNIGGSFFASTASSVKFPDGTEFSATNPEAPPLLTVNVKPPVGLLFEGSGAFITNEGNLAAGQDLTLSADNLDLQGQLKAGRNLTLKAQDTVSFSPKGNGGNIILSAGHDITIDSLKSSFVDSRGVNGGNGGDIFLTAGHDITTDSLNSLSFIPLGSVSGDAGNGGNIIVHSSASIFQTRSSIVIRKLHRKW